MKRVFIIQNTPLGAPLPLSIYLTSLLETLVLTKDFELNLIVSKSENLPEIIKKKCNKIYQFEGSTYSIKDNFKFSFFVRKVLTKENKEKQIAIVHCFYPNSSLLGAVMFKWMHKEAKLVYDLRSPWIDMSIEREFVSKHISSLYRKLLYVEEKFLCKHVNSFMFVTKGLAEYYKHEVGLKPPQSVYVSPSGVNFDNFKRVSTNIRKTYDIKQDELLIGSIGGIAQVRRQDEFLYLFKEVVEKRSKVKLMFVGDGDLLPKLKELTAQLGLDKNVIFTGTVPHKDIPKYISAFDFGLNHLPNIFVHRHNCSLKIMEYLSCEVPVIASKIESNEELAQHLKNIYIYTNAKDIIKYLEMKPVVKKQSALNDFSWVTIKKNYETMWSQLNE